jgi:hypothetical protein
MDFNYLVKLIQHDDRFAIPVPKEHVNLHIYEFYGENRLQKKKNDGEIRSKDQIC